MKDGRINIGLFVSNLENSFDNAVCEGVMRGAKEVDANLIVFPGRYLKGQYYERDRTRCEYQNNALFSYVNEQNIDVLLILMGTIGTVLTEAEKKVFLDMYQNIPIFLLADEIEGYSNIVFDNRSGLREGIIDLIVNKKKKCIGMFSGPMTNEDAAERLDVYRETLREFDMEVVEERIAYGDFSEFCEDKVKDFIRRNPDMDAIVFANDQMAIGGYNAMKEMGIRIGEDIAVMGFDDSPAASTLEPNLTSVRADAVELGRQGTIEAVNFYATGVIRNKVVKTSLIQRKSSGNSDNIYFSELEKNAYGEVLANDITKAAAMLVEEIFDESTNDREQLYFTSLLKNFIKVFYEQVQTLTVGDAKERVAGVLEKAMKDKGQNLVILKNIYTLFDTLKKIVDRYCTDVHQHQFACDLLYSYLMLLESIDAKLRHQAAMDLDEIMYTSNALTRDMLVHGEDNDMSYMSVTAKLGRLGVKSAYLYTFGNPYINKDSSVWHDWRIPATALLKSYFYEQNQIEVVPKKEQKIKTPYLFHNQFMPKGRRYTLFMNTIFINDEQLGMLLCEIEHNQIPFLPPILAQLSSAFKILHMLKMQAGIQKQLEVSLKKIQESNQILETISKSDELTGIYNRRGFFEQAVSKARDSKNVGKTAILLFVDLDNLKIINDQLGHDEGDFALKSVADILTDSMRASDVVARIGGDEFAALAIIEKQATGDTIKMRIKNLTEQFNQECTKPYYIGVSVGYAEFICDKDVELEPYLDMADAKLYEDKQKKRKKIMKQKTKEPKAES